MNKYLLTTLLLIAVAIQLFFLTMQVAGVYKPTMWWFPLFNFIVTTGSATYALNIIWKR